MIAARHSRKCEKSRRAIASGKEEYERERNVVLRAAARGIHIFFCRDLNLNGRRTAARSDFFVCARREIPYTSILHTRESPSIRVENGLYRGECVRSVLVPIGSEHQRFSRFEPGGQIRRVSGSSRGARVDRGDEIITDRAHFKRKTRHSQPDETLDDVRFIQRDIA